MSELFVKSIDKIKDVIQDSNINFLIGSGTSVPFFGTLGNIENWLTDLNGVSKSEAVKEYVKASIYKSYFDVAMGDYNLIRDYEGDSKNYPPDIKSPEEKLQYTLVSYITFLSTINNIIYERRSNTVTKQVNLFTTNIDVFLEKTIEMLNLQYNDGFHGIFNQKFSLSNFKRSYFQKSLHYDNVSELPVFNLLKMHGSVTWVKKDELIAFDNLGLINEIKISTVGIDFLDVKGANDKCWNDNDREITISELCDLVDETKIPNCTNFVSEYEKLQIVNPTKEKFKDTTFNKNYYEILRLYSNEMEKEGTSLFVMGFSMADEHIREITIRALKSNPTLFVFICSYGESASDIIGNFEKDGFDISKHRNIRLICLENGFDLKKVNELLFGKILHKLKNPEDGK